METTTLPNTAANPLAKYFRQPAIYIKLPGAGKFWAEGSLNLPVNGEIPIYPMTTRDEVTLRTPDALMNGSGVVSVIESCCPNIIDAWKTPTVDVDAILIAIRIASYGQQMDVETTCPHCNEKNTHALDLINCLGGIQCPDYSQPIAIDNLKIKLKAQIYFGSNQPTREISEKLGIDQNCSIPYYDGPNDDRTPSAFEVCGNLLNRTLSSDNKICFTREEYDLLNSNINSQKSPYLANSNINDDLIDDQVPSKY